MSEENEEIIIDDEVREGLRHFLVKRKLTSGISDEVYLPIHKVRQHTIQKYFLEKIKDRNSDHANLIPAYDTRDKVKVLRRLFDAANFPTKDVAAELFISAGNPSFTELKMRTNQVTIEKRLGELSSTTPPERTRQLLMDLIVEKEEFILHYELAEKEELARLESEINDRSNDRKAILLNSNIRKHDLKSLSCIIDNYTDTSIITDESLRDELKAHRNPCSCKGEDECLSDKCAHFKEAEPPYDSKGFLRSFNRQHIIFECNEHCSCDPSHCGNRVVQKGSDVAKEVFSTLNTREGGHGIGLGVRAREFIEKGAFIGTYGGKLMNSKEYDESDEPYAFDVSKSKKLGAFVIVATNVGNIMKLMNHSCVPNVEGLCVHTAISDPRAHEIAFFACRDIVKGEELCINYGKKYLKKITCCCFSCKTKKSVKPKRKRN